MKAYTLYVHRRQALRHKRTYISPGGAVQNLTNWATTFEIRTIPQLHGEDTVVATLSRGSGITVDDVNGTAEVIVPQATIASMTHGSYIWVWTLTPPEVGAQPTLFGWGVVEVAP